MNTVKILHCADIHIGASEAALGNSSAERRYETVLTFEKIIETAKSLGIKFLIISGDLLDSNKIDSSFIDAVFAKITAAEEINIIFAAGNHDPLTADSPFLTREKPQNLYIMPTEDSYFQFDEQKVRIYGKSFAGVYMHGEQRFTLTPPDDDYINILAIHGELKNDFSSNYNPITADFIKNCSMDYIALGHIHKRTDLGKIGSSYFAYPGCPEGHGFDELDEKGVYIAEIGKNSCSLEFLPVSKRLYIYEKIDITDCTAATDVSNLIIKSLEEKYSDTYKNYIYKIELTGELDEAVSFSTSEILSRISPYVYFAKINNQTLVKIDFETLSKEISLKGIFVKNMLSKLDNADQNQKPLLRKALNLGIKAFASEVEIDEN